MGRRIKLIGADFSAVALPLQNAHTTAELLTSKGFYQVASDGSSISYQDRPTGTWRTAILELHDNMYVENATAASYEGVASGIGTPVPAIAFLSSNDASSYISGSNIYPNSGSSEVFFAKFSGVLNPPSGATHVIITTNIGQGGSEDSIISWD